MVRTPVCELLGIEQPIVLAAMVAVPELAAAVSNAGGLGIVALTWSDPARDVVRETVELTDRPFCGNLVLTSDQHRRLDEAQVQGVHLGGTIISRPDRGEPDEHRRWTERTRRIAEQRTGRSRDRGGRHPRGPRRSLQGRFTPASAGVSTPTSLSTTASGSCNSRHRDCRVRCSSVSWVFHPGAPGAQPDLQGTGDRVNGPDPDHTRCNSFATFEDPDGNGRLFQQGTDPA